MKKLFLIIAFIGIWGYSYAQSAQDALIYSQTFYTGTARSMAMGNAFGALGADLSVASTNPAGIGLFRYNLYSITPAFNFNGSQSSYNGVGANDNELNMGIDNLGFVIARKLNDKNSNGWKFLQFAFGMNKMNDFHSSIDMQGPNATNSRLDTYINQADGTNYNDIANNTNNNYTYFLQPAWDLYLIDTIPGYNNLYYSPVPFGGTYQQNIINTAGAVNQWFFTVSANYNNILYVGATVGFNSLKYVKNSYYSEIDAADTIPYFNSWGVDERVETNGTGVNLKLGAILQPVDWLRIGVAFHTPTWYWDMNDTWQTKTHADLGWGTPSTVVSPTGSFNYTLTTPMKILGDVGIIIGKWGVISAEYERVDYSTMKLNSSNYNFATENGNIKNYYRAQNDIRLGTEWRFGNTDLRAGYAYYSSPYANNLNNGARNVISGGVGFHIYNYTLDLAYVHAVQKQNYYFYGDQYVTVNPSNNTYNRDAFVFTLSYRF